MIAEIKVLESSQGTNTYLLTDEEKNSVIIDPDADAGRLGRHIDKNGYTLQGILLTHGHYDHTSSVLRLKEKYGCKIYAAEKEKELLADSRQNLSCFIGDDREIEADVLVEEGDTISIGTMEFKVLETPGHTVGSICFIIENYLISGDTLFLGSCGRTDFATGSWEEIQHSLRRLSRLNEDYVVLPGHGPKTTLNHEKLTNPFMK